MPALPQHTQTDKIVWMGYTWDIKNGSGMGPGPNYWRKENVWVDDKGYLHLKITRTANVWYCAELSTTKPLGFGAYQWQVVYKLDELDPNVVMGLFHYAGPDGYREIDIEYARWGDPQNKGASWTVYPEKIPGKVKTHPFAIALTGTFTTSRYIWSSAGVNYVTMGGFQPLGTVTNKLATWNYRPTNPKISIPQKPMPLCMNLWLFDGEAPTDNKEVEVIIRDFQKS
jgi:hypothetical protein